MKKINYLLYVIAIFCILSGSIWAQSANLSGTVRDAAGAVVPNANVVLTGDNGTRREAVSCDDGTFTFGQLSPGVYTLRVEASGFRALVRENVEITDSNPVLDFNLEVGAVSEAVTVTAQRQEENLQDVPISLRPFSNREIEDRLFTGTIDALQATPNINVTAANASPNRDAGAIRGIGTIINDADPSVGVYIDDVFVGNDGGFNLDLVDTERVEVLRGPQGTLYGRSALGGAVNFISNQPTNDASGEIDLRYGNYNYFTARGTANVPIIKDKLFTRLTFAGTRRDGTVRNVFDDSRINDLGNAGGRLQIFYLPTDRLDITLRGDYSVYKTSRFAYGDFDTVTNQRVNLLLPFAEDRRVYGVSGRAEYRFNRATFSSITAGRGNSFDAVGSDFSTTNVLFQGFDYRQNQFTQEFRVASSTAGRIRYVAGYFYFRENLRNFNFVSLAQGMPAFGFPRGYREDSDGLIRTDSNSVFGDATFAVTPKLFVTAGLRLTRDRKKLDYSFFNNPNLPFFFFAPPRTATDAATFNNLSPRFAIRYAFDENFSAYATAARGYKSGSFNNVFVGSHGFRYEPETAWNYEAGFKSAFFNRRLTANLAAFYFDWKNQQAQVFNGNVVLTVNAPRSRSVGGELEIAANPVKGLELTVGVGYNDAVFKELREPLTGFDVGGNRQPYASRLTVNLTAQQRFDLNENNRLRVRADYSFRSGLFFDFVNTLFQPEVHLVNANVAFERKRFDVSFLASNLFDRKYRVAGFRALVGLTPSPLAIPGDPRTFGIVTRVRF
jgi:iron complex outermembrane receptor protein